MIISILVVSFLFLLTCYFFKDQCSFCKNTVDIILPESRSEVEEPVKANKNEVEKPVGAKNPIKKEAKEAVKKIAEKAPLEVKAELVKKEPKKKKAEPKKNLKDIQKRKRK
jgi:hypothetical protein